MSLIAYCPEEQVEAFGEKLTLRLDFEAISAIETGLQMTMPVASAYVRTAKPAPRSLLALVLWGMLRKHNPEVTRDEALGIVMDEGLEGAKVGFAVDALLERCFPLATEDKKSKNVRKRSGRSKSTAAAG